VKSRAAKRMRVSPDQTSSAVSQRSLSFLALQCDTSRNYHTTWHLQPDAAPTGALEAHPLLTAVGIGACRRQIGSAKCDRRAGVLACGFR
jgi:hypothetical protein